MPLFDKDELLKCIKMLVAKEKSWYKFKDGQLDHQIYIRVCQISTDHHIGVKSPLSTKLFVILSPNSLKIKPKKLVCNSNAYKNWTQGNGAFRISGNFGPLVPNIERANENGFDDVLWLIDDYVKELTMQNFFVYWKNRKGEHEIVTPPLDGTVFNGILRQSLIELAEKLK